MSIALDFEELDLFVWNDSTSYFKGLELARKVRDGKRVSWRWFVRFCISRYRSDVGPARPEKGLVDEAARKFCEGFIEHLKECDD